MVLVEDMLQVKSLFATTILLQMILCIDIHLKGLHDWRNMPDIVRLTLKTLTNVVKNQGEAIRDLER